MTCKLCKDSKAKKTKNGLNLCEECLITVDFVEKLVFITEQEINSSNTVHPKNHDCFGILNVFASLAYTDKNFRFYIQACKSIASNILRGKSTIDFTEFIQSKASIAHPKVLAFPFLTTDLIKEVNNIYHLKSRTNLFFNELKEISDPSNKSLSLSDTEQTCVRTIFGFIVASLFQQYGREQKLMQSLNLKNSWIKFTGIFGFAYLKVTQFTENELINYYKSKHLGKKERDEIIDLLLGFDAFNNTSIIDKGIHLRRPGRMDGEFTLMMNLDFANQIDSIRTDDRLVNLTRDITRENIIERR